MLYCGYTARNKSPDDYYHQDLQRKSYRERK